MAPPTGDQSRPALIFGVGDELKVLGVDAVPDLADVIQFAVFGDGTARQLPDDLVGLGGTAPTTAKRLPVAVVVQTGLPEPMSVWGNDIADVLGTTYPDEHARASGTRLFR